MMFQDGLQRFRQARADGSLRQGTWRHSDGSCCLLALLYPSARHSGEVVSAMLPDWLVQIIPPLFDGLSATACLDWGEALIIELSRFEGQALPRGILHDWMMNGLLPVLKESCELRHGHPEQIQALMGLHRDALAHIRHDYSTWFSSLEVGLHAAFTYAYDYASAYQQSYLRCLQHAQAHHYPDAEPMSREYGEENALANRRAFVKANVAAHAALDAEWLSQADTAQPSPGTLYGQLQAVAQGYLLTVGCSAQEQVLLYQRFADALLDAVRQARRSYA